MEFHSLCIATFLNNVLLGKSDDVQQTNTVQRVMIYYQRMGLIYRYSRTAVDAPSSIVIVSCISSLLAQLVYVAWQAFVSGKHHAGIAAKFASTSNLTGGTDFGLVPL